MDRRRAIVALAAFAGPIAIARAQESAKLRTIGFLSPTTPSAENQRLAAFTQRLRELGWIEGRTIALNVRWGEGRNARFADIASEFVQLKVDVIATQGTAATIAAKRATSVIPIVSAVIGDPVGTGLVTNLARPGGNLTGLSIQSNDSSGKRIELLREVVPGLRRLAILGNIGNPVSVLEMRAVEGAARTLGLEVHTVQIRVASDIVPALERIPNNTQAFYVAGDPLITSNWTRINTVALRAQVATISTVREYVEAGALMSYGPNFLQLFRRAADLVDKILRGTRPGDIPIEQPTKFDLVINRTTAKALGLAISKELLLRADEVIE